MTRELEPGRGPREENLEQDGTLIDPVKAFGNRFRDLRTIKGLTQRKMAQLLHVDESTVARIEAGTRRPPRAVSFYENLKKIPDVTEAEIIGLLRTEDAPAWLVRDEGNVAVQNLAENTASFGGISAGFSIQAEAGILSIGDLDDLSAMAKIELTSLLRHFSSVKAQRSKKLGNDYQI